MHPLRASFLVFIGAGVGALGRFWLGQFVNTVWGSRFPWGTGLVNLSGCALIGLALGWLSRNPGDTQGLRALLVVGVLGGYTTFSSFAAESLTLIREGRVVPALAYGLGSWLFGIAACWLGYAAAGPKIAN